MATHKLDLDTDAGELIIRAGDVHRTATAPHRLSASEWEEALKQLDKRVTNSITLGMTVRSLDLDGNPCARWLLRRCRRAPWLLPLQRPRHSARFLLQKLTGFLLQRLLP